MNIIVGNDNRFVNGCEIELAAGQYNEARKRSKCQETGGKQVKLASRVM
jgi:hypothetical protein